MLQDSDIVLSTVFLNWNRGDLLKVSVESYLKTIEVPYELIIIDNGSTDNSRDVIRELKDRYGNKISEIILLDKNLGGEAINIGLEKARGKLLHISENDIEYLPHWSTKVVRLFQVFDKLGQLSLFSPVPTDEEVWVPHPIKKVLYKDGEIIYEALGNVGTTSVIRREIWDKGVRVHNISGGEFLFPDDARLSSDIVKLGYIVAWAPYYLVRNLGHTYSEIMGRIEYYRSNYNSKKDLGYEGLLKRIEYYEKRIKPARRSILNFESVIQPELSSLFKPILNKDKVLDAQAWSCLDAITPEIENLELIYSLIRSFKPSLCVDVTPFGKHTVNVIKKALKDNNYGELVILSDNSNLSSLGLSLSKTESYESFLKMYQNVDCIIFNSYYINKLEIFEHILPKLTKRSLIIVTGNYDNIENMKKVWNALDKNDYNCTFISSARGIIVCTSDIKNQLQQYSKNTISKRVSQYIYKNRILNRLVAYLYKLKISLHLRTSSKSSL